MPLDVLIVDDDQDVHEALTGLIEDHGLLCTIRHAFNGEEALQIMRSKPPDLLILDIRMPIMDGLALREEMFHDPNLAGVQLAVFTGHAMNQTELQVLLADYYIPKAGNRVSEELVAVVEKARIEREGLPDRLKKRREATVLRIDTVIADMQRLRDELTKEILHT